MPSHFYRCVGKMQSQGTERLTILRNLETLSVRSGIKKEDASSYRQFIQALPLFRGLVCLLAIAFDVRVGSDIIARMEGTRREKARRRWRLKVTDQVESGLDGGPFYTPQTLTRKTSSES